MSDPTTAWQITEEKTLSRTTDFEMALKGWVERRLESGYREKKDVDILSKAKHSDSKTLEVRSSFGGI